MKFKNDLLSLKNFIILFALIFQITDIHVTLPKNFGSFTNKTSTHLLHGNHSVKFNSFLFLICTLVCKNERRSLKINYQRNVE